MMNELPDQSGPGEACFRREPPESGLVVSSEDLLRGRQEVMIEHNGDIYRLRHTRQGKLILTK